MVDSEGYCREGLVVGVIVCLYGIMVVGGGVW